jgi:uncharacterized repeat protein (TIGR01451 family)
MPAGNGGSSWGARTMNVVENIIAVMFVASTAVPVSQFPVVRDVETQGGKATRTRAGALSLTMRVTAAAAPPVHELRYVSDYHNTGTEAIANVVVVTPIPARTHFKVGSASVGVPPEGVVAILVQYSKDGGVSWRHTPVDGGAGADTGYDAAVTHVRFVVVGRIEPGASSTSGVSVTVRVVCD